MFTIFMEPDFQEINQESVGYRISANQPGGPYRLDVLTFEEFIPPYSQRTDSHKQVYDNLEKELDSAIKQQDSVTDGKRSVMMDVLATATLQRESMRKSIDLIREHYL